MRRRLWHNPSGGGKMILLSILVQITGATMLLLFAVRMVRTGIERLFGATFRRYMLESESLPRAALTGTGLALVLQSSAAVAVLAAGFAGNGAMSFATGLGIVLGGDLGSALVIQVLSMRVDWMIPLLLASGGWLYVGKGPKTAAQIGRVLMGIAFVLIALQFLREAVEPIQSSAFLPQVSGYLANDFVTAFIVGVALAFVMHSSVAAILMVVALVQIGALPFEAALAILLGANMGSALIPVWLSRSMPVPARRIPLANLILRGALAIAVTFALFGIRPDLIPAESSAQWLVQCHIGFNLLVVIVGLPLCRMLEPALETLLPDTPVDVDSSVDRSALDASVLELPEQAVACVKRELLRMLERVENMFGQVDEILRVVDSEAIVRLKSADEEVNRYLDEIRAYVASVPNDAYGKDEKNAMRGLMDYAIRLESAGDGISKRMSALAEEKLGTGVEFSEEGWAEITSLASAIEKNFRLAANVLVSDDLESARLLVIEKSELKRKERKSRKRHVIRLQEGRAESLLTSDVHLEVLRLLRDINGHISAVAYPILVRHGQLLETRLAENMQDVT